MGMGAMNAVVKLFLKQTDQAGMRSKLGISAAADAILDDASNSAILDTLGFSSLGKTLAAVASAAAARTAIGAGVGWTYASKNAGYTAADGEYAYVDNSGGTIAVTMPAAGAGKAVGVKINTQSVSNAKDVTLTRAGSDTFEGGGTTFVMDQAMENYEFRVGPTSTEWLVFG